MNIENAKSAVRIGVTWIAAIYTFVGSAALITASFLLGDEGNQETFEQAKDLFMLVLPVATGIITYWFASRKSYH